MVRIPFLGAYCSNHFNWSGADFELRLEVSKSSNSKVALKGPSNPLMQIACDSLDTSVYKLTFLSSREWEI